MDRSEQKWTEEDGNRNRPKWTKVDQNDLGEPK